MAINIEIHTGQCAENKRLWRAQPSIGCLITSFPPRLRDHHGSSIARCYKPGVGRRREKQCLLNMTEPLCSWTRGSYSCLHKIKQGNLLTWNERGVCEFLPPYWGVIELMASREGNYIFFKSMAPGRSTILQRMPPTHTNIWTTLVRFDVLYLERKGENKSTRRWMDLWVGGRVVMDMI